MNSLIEKLDTTTCVSKTLPSTLSFEEVKTKTDKIYGLYFDKHYEKRFHAYMDLDKCNDGFRLLKKPLVKPRRKHIQVKADIQSLADLIQLIDDYPLSSQIKYDINIEGLHKIRKYLVELNAFIGLEELKENLLDQLIYFMHGKSDDYLHTVLYGPPGTGKTEIAKLLGQIYTNLGILKNGTFVKVTRSDFVAGYLGQTATKTQKLIEENLGGVIFIDEAYAMGNEEKRDSFSKEALDTLCEMLSDYKDQLMVIIAGYRKELDACFFSYNQGLISRFAWQFEIEEYSSKQLQQIFHKKVKDVGWSIEEGVASESWFAKHMESFKNYGRDMENLFSKCKICYYRRNFGKKQTRPVLSERDLERGYDKYLKYTNRDTNEKEPPPNFMYS